MKQKLLSLLRNSERFLKLFGRNRYSFYHRFFYERPSKTYQKKMTERGKSLHPDFIKWAKEFEKNGVVSIPEVLKAEELQELKTEFSSLLSSEIFENQSQRWGREKMPDSYAMSKLACHPILVTLCKYLWGKPVFLAEAYGYRYFPCPADMPYSSEQYWHHDGNMKQLKVFFILTDLPENGQCFHYVLGSHKNWWWKWRKEKNLIPENEAIQLGETKKFFGQAGTVLIFDTNGIHRVERTLSGPLRDVIVFTYTAGKITFEIPGFHPSVLKDSSLEIPKIQTAGL